MFTRISDIKAANRAKGDHWFSPDTLRFFGSRIESEVINGRYFLTSENNYNRTERLYSIRRANDDGSIGTMGEFQGFTTKHDAEAAARMLEG